MTLLAVIIQLVGVTALMLLVATGLFVGRERLSRTREQYRDRIRAIAPYIGLLVVVLVANKIARDIGPQVSWIIGFRITGYLHWIDGRLLWFLDRQSPPQVIEFLQAHGTPEITAYFSFIYVYGYVFLLVFPLIAYFALERPQPLRRTIVAYSANYIIGVTCYVLFVALGPRNLEVGQGLLYTTYPRYQFLTTAINANTNVFPSLHTSLAVTAALLAWTTRDEYPIWFPLASVIAASVVFATMYLGIHWAADVFAGIALAVISVRLGQRFEDRPPKFSWVKKRLGRAIPTRAR